ncbi:hypothetical protein MJH12_18295, partial [bacterium]|nr:hypothetical protein [bacterium]
MSAITLVNKFIKQSETQFPNIFIDYYFCGSRMDDSSNQHSDLDMILVINRDIDQTIQTKFAEFLDDFNTYPEIETITLDTRELKDLPAWAKNAQHMHGVHSFQEIPLESMEDAKHRFIHGVYRFLYIFLRRSDKSLSYPLSLPNKEAEFYGYHLAQSDFGLSTKRFVSCTARICGALLSLNHNYQPKSKKDSIFTFLKLAKSEHHDFVTNCYQKLSIDWNYEVPKDPKDLTHLHEILIQFHQFENYFLEEIQDYMK